MNTINMNTAKMNAVVRKSAVNAYLEGASAYKLSQAYGVSAGTIRRWVKKEGYNTRGRSEAFLVSDLMSRKQLSK
jgi:transposase